MIKKNETPKILFLRKKLIEEQNQPNYFSFSNTNKDVSTKQSNITNSLRNKSLTKKKNLKSNTIQNNYKGLKAKIGKIEYYKMKNLDIDELMSQKEEKIELIKQKKLFNEKKDKIYNVKSMDLISKLKEKECRMEITMLQKKLLNLNDQKNQIYKYYEIILLIIKTIEKYIDSEFEQQENVIKDKINFDINQSDTNFENKLNEICKLSDYLLDKINELFEKMNIMIKSYDKIKLRIKSLNGENADLRKKIKDINRINHDISKKINKIKIEKEQKDEDNVSLFYRKMQNNLTKKYIERANKAKQRLLQKRVILNKEITNQTLYTSNKINLLTSKSNSKENMLSLSNNFISSETSSISSREKSNGKINLKEINYINKLKNKIKILKIKIRQIKEKQNLPKNAFYDLINKIMKKISEEESDIIIDDIYYQFLNDNMKIFPYQSYKIRKRFVDYLFVDVNLYKILNSKNLKGINYFKFGFFKKKEKLTI